MDKNLYLKSKVTPVITEINLVAHSYAVQDSGI